jgi:hypothetical protein
LEYTPLLFDVVVVVAVRLLSRASKKALAVGWAALGNRNVDDDDDDSSTVIISVIVAFSVGIE